VDDAPQWRWPRAGPAIVAVVMFCALLALIEPVVGLTAVFVVAVGLAAMQSGTLLFMATVPEWAMAVALAAGVGLEAVSPNLPLGLATIPLSALAAVRPPRVSRWALLAMLALAPWRAFGGGGVLGVTFAVLAPLLAWTCGELLRTTRVRRAGEARRAVAEERERIARELHDVLAHNVSVIVVQAAAAGDVFETHPEQAREALRAIEASGRVALSELRRLLSVVRPDGDDDLIRPQPGLDQLDALVASMQAVGLAVDVRREGDRPPLPAGVELSAYRIIQEALTNTLRHAGATRADVTVRYAADAVTLEVIDNGTAAPRTNGAGQGIVGMRERAGLLGGSVEAGPAPWGGFQVRARLPLEVCS
jgi:signal transduction histidine kinase